MVKHGRIKKPDADLDLELEEYEPSDLDDDYDENEKVLLEKSANRNAKFDEDEDESEEEVFRIHSSDDEEEEEEDEGNQMDPVGDDMDSDIEGKGDDERDGLPSSKAWGTKRKNYYHTDYVDQDYGGFSKAEEEEAALLEEQEARAIQDRLVAELEDTDFTLGLLSKVEEKEDKAKNKMVAAVDEVIKTDLSKLSKREKLALLDKESPEFMGLVNDFKGKTMWSANNNTARCPLSLLPASPEVPQNMSNPSVFSTVLPDMPSLSPLLDLPTESIIPQIISPLPASPTSFSLFEDIQPVSPEIPQFNLNPSIFDSPDMSSLHPIQLLPGGDMSPRPSYNQQGQGTSSIEISTITLRRFPKFKTTARDIIVKFPDPPANRNHVTWLRERFDELVAYIRQEAADHDRIGVTIHSPEHRSIGIGLRRADQVSSDVILSLVEKVIQSNERFTLDGALTIKIVHVNMPNGGKRDNKSQNDNFTFDEFCRRKRSVMRITNKDDKLCLARPIAVAIGHLEKKRLTYAKDKLEPIISMVKSKEIPKCSATEFVSTKYHLTLNYCTNIAFYLLLKAKHINIQSHPVVKRLFQYRKLLEQMDTVDAEAIEPQIDQILQNKKDGQVVPFNKEQNKTRPEKRKKLKLLTSKDREEAEVEAHIPTKKLKFAAKVEEAPLEEIIGEDNEEDSNDEVEEVTEESDAKRGITFQIAKNKGLTPNRKKEMRNPRVKNRNKFRRAKIRRKGQVREVRKETTRYGGEIFGIKASLSKSIKLK